MTDLMNKLLNILSDPDTAATWARNITILVAFCGTTLVALWGVATRRFIAVVSRYSPEGKRRPIGLAFFWRLAEERAAWDPTEGKTEWHFKKRGITRVLHPVSLTGRHNRWEVVLTLRVYGVFWADSQNTDVLQVGPVLFPISGTRAYYPTHKRYHYMLGEKTHEAYFVRQGLATLRALATQDLNKVSSYDELSQMIINTAQRTAPRAYWWLPVRVRCQYPAPAFDMLGHGGGRSFYRNHSDNLHAALTKKIADWEQRLETMDG